MENKKTEVVIESVDAQRARTSTAEPLHNVQHTAKDK